MGESQGGGWGYSGVRSLWVHCCQCPVYPGSLVSTCRHLHLMIPPVSQEGVECSSKMWTQLFNRATAHPDSRGGPCVLLLAPRLPALHFRAPLPLSYTATLFASGLVAHTPSCCGHMLQVLLHPACVLRKQLQAALRDRAGPGPSELHQDADIRIS